MEAKRQQSARKDLTVDTRLSIRPRIIAGTDRTTETSGRGTGASAQSAHGSRGGTGQGETRGERRPQMRMKSRLRYIHRVISQISTKTAHSSLTAAGAVPA